MVEGNLEGGGSTPRTRETKATAVLEFEQVFGDLDHLQEVWIRSERASASIPVANATLDHADQR